MTVSTATARVSYVGNGVTVSFSVPFPFIDNDYLTVIRVNTTTLVETPLVLDSLGANGFSVTGAGEASGSLVTVTAPTSAEQLTIIRSVPETQEADFVANDPLPAESLEDALDKLTMLVSQNTASIGRAFRLSDGAPSTISTTMPVAASNYYLRWNAAANALESVAVVDVGSISVSLFMEPILALNTPADVKAALELGAFAADYTTIATDTLLGRSTAGSGDVEAIPCNALGRSVIAAASTQAARTALAISYPYDLAIACSDETTDIAAGNNVVRMRAPRAFTCSKIWASLNTASSSGGPVTIDVEKNGVSVFTTTITIDDTELTSLDAAVQPVLNGTLTFAEGDLIGIDIVADGTGADGLKVYLVGSVSP